MLGATPPCIPSWIHAITAERARANAVGVLGRALGGSTECQVDSTGIVPCAPESMRAKAEARVKALGLYPRSRSLSLDAYTIARVIRSEAGSGSIPEKVLMATSTIARAALDGDPISKIAMKDGKRYGKQSGTNPAVASSKDPTWEEIAIAEMALTGVFGGFGGGATHYFSPRIMDAWHKDGRTKDRWGTYATWTDGWGSSKWGYAWVGPVPGIDHNEQFLMKRVPKNSPEWRDAYDAGKAALGDKRTPAIAHAGACEDAADYYGRRQGSVAGLVGSMLIAMFFGGSLGVFFGSYLGPEAASGRARRRS